MQFQPENTGLLAYLLYFDTELRLVDGTRICLPGPGIHFHNPESFGPVHVVREQKQDESGYKPLELQVGVSNGLSYFKFDGKIGGTFLQDTACRVLELLSRVARNVNKTWSVLDKAAKSGCLAGACSAVCTDLTRTGQELHEAQLHPARNVLTWTGTP